MRWGSGLACQQKNCTKTRAASKQILKDRCCHSTATPFPRASLNHFISRHMLEHELQQRLLLQQTALIANRLQCTAMQHGKA